MINYILSIFYIFIFLVSLFFIGNTIFRKVENLPIRIIYSYILYKFFTSSFGIIVQFFKLSFFPFVIFMILLWIALLGFSFYKMKKDDIKITKDEIVGYKNKYWFVIVVSFILIFFSIINIPYHWFGNHLDDGFYVNTVYDYANNVDTFKIHPSTGLNRETKFDAYSLNTWQIESAFYAKIFHVNPTVLLKFGQSFINYFLFIILILAFLEKILPKKIIEKYEYELQFIPIVTVLFIFQFNVLNLMLFLQDGWQFGNAMYYGSTIIRTMGIFLLLLPLIDNEKLQFKDFVIYGIISFILLAQSAVALPVVLLVAISYFISYLLLEVKNKKILLLFIFILILIGIVLPNISLLNMHAFNLLKANKNSFILYGTIVLFLMGFLYKDKNISKINTILLLMICFIYIPQINDITENLSMYDFVEARLWTGIFYTIAILAFTYVFIFLCKTFNKKKLMIAKFVMFFLLICGAFLSFHFKHINVINSLVLIKNNSKLLPHSTVLLGNKLEKLYQDKKRDLYVLTPDWIYINNYDHSLAVLLRQHSKSIKVVSAIPRYATFTDKEFKGYSQKENDTYNEFVHNPTDKTYGKVKKMLNKYPINCIVTFSDKSKKYLNKSEFKLEKSFCDDNMCYYIYYKEK